jgi:hypothetical protein
LHFYQASGLGYPINVSILLSLFRTDQPFQPASGDFPFHFVAPMDGIGMLVAV